jgi:hypothetical protein
MVSTGRRAAIVCTVAVLLCGCMENRAIEERLLGERVREAKACLGKSYVETAWGVRWDRYLLLRSCVIEADQAEGRLTTVSVQGSPVLCYSMALRCL